MRCGCRGLDAGPARPPVVAASVGRGTGDQLALRVARPRIGLAPVEAEGLLHLLVDRGVPLVAIPKTMDNDVPGTDYCIGFSTCVTRTIELTHRLRTSAGSHERFLVIEVSYAEALTDHHAFTFFPARKALGIPMQLTDESGRVTSTGLEVFHVDAALGIEHRGTVEQLALFEGQDLQSWNAGCAVVRGVFPRSVASGWFDELRDREIPREEIDALPGPVLLEFGASW